MYNVILLAAGEGTRLRPHTDDRPKCLVELAGRPLLHHNLQVLASVGLTEEEAGARGFAFAVKANDLTGWRSSQTHAESAAFSKVLIEAGTGRILGAHIVGHGAEEIIHLFAFAMKQGITAQGLGESVYAYPTFASDIKHML